MKRSIVSNFRNVVCTRNLSFAPKVSLLVPIVLKRKKVCAIREIGGQIYEDTGDEKLFGK